MAVPFSDIKAMVLAGFKSSFLPFHEKQALLREVSAELAQYDDHGQRTSQSLGNLGPRPVELRAADAS
jgi:adenosine deaminase